MKPKIPDLKFEEKEADRLIANFGNKPSDEKRHEIDLSLKAQKEKFLAQQLQKDKSRSNEHGAG